jgi:hypothetical protein
MTADILEWKLASLEILKTELEEDPLDKQPAMDLRRDFVNRVSLQTGRTADDLQNEDED